MQLSIDQDGTAEENFMRAFAAAMKIGVEHEFVEDIRMDMDNYEPEQIRKAEDKESFDERVNRLAMTM